MFQSILKYKYETYTVKFHDHTAFAVPLTWVNKDIDIKFSMHGTFLE